jgi:hypothetical protein
LTEAGHRVLAEHHSISTLRGEFQSRQDKGRPFALNEVFEMLSCLGPLLALVQHLQPLIELHLGLTASGDLAEKPNHNGTLYAS